MDRFIQVLFAIAIAFWSPYNGNVDPCPQGPSYTIFTQGTWNPPPAEVGKVVAWSYVGHDCHINLAPKWTYLARTPQIACMIIIHELGHSAMGIEKHTPTGVMRLVITRQRPIGACYSIPRRVIPPAFPRRRARPSSIPLGNPPRHMQEPVPIGSRTTAVG